MSEEKRISLEEYIDALKVVEQYHLQIMSDSDYKQDRKSAVLWT
jgi:hypothetical protein